MAAREPVSAAKAQQPLASGLTERAGVTLMLLDVEVAGKDGRPIQGLTKKDFSVRLDGRSWPIYSVDDLCSCAEPTLPQAADTQARLQMVPRTGVPEVEADPARYVIYFDFSQLQIGGRARALKEAARWVNETMRPGDLVMLAAFATASRARVLSPFTGDRDRLIAAIDEAGKDPGLVDPFPSWIDQRVLECDLAMEQRPPSPLVCFSLATEEYYHGRRSLMALKNFLVSLDQVPGRKAILFFHENGNLFPGKFYHGALPDRDHARLLEQVGAEATESHAVVYPASVGDMQLFTEQSKQAVNLGLNLADFTGGRYNRGPTDVSRLIDEARTRCSCVYRIGLEPPDRRRYTVYRASVRVDGRALSYDYRVLSLTESNRWMRKAQAVLEHPEESRDVTVTAGLVPVQASGKRWDLMVEVALDLGSITMLPSAAGRSGSWEVGGLLSRDDAEETWEMLGVSTAHAGDRGGPGTWVLHERAFSSLRPGRYHLAAFVRDTEANVFGAAEASLELPAPRAGAVAGPIMMRPDRTRIVSALPLFRQGRAETGSVTSLLTGPIPAGDSAARAGEPLQIETWLCPGESGPRASEPPSGKTLRFITGNGIPLVRFEDTKPEPAGACFLIADRIEHWQPSPGDYAYHLRWLAPDGTEVASAEMPFEIVSGSAGSPASR